MKNIDITRKIMQDIASMERRRITSFRRKLSVAFGGLVIIFAGIAFIIYRILLQQQTFDLLTVFSEDREIIAEFWQDTVMSILMELPLTEIVLGGIVVCTVLAMGIATRKRRSITKRKEKELQKYL